jgi:hypothetical protein
MNPRQNKLPIAPTLRQQLAASRSLFGRVIPLIAGENSELKGSLAVDCANTADLLKLRLKVNDRFALCAVGTWLLWQIIVPLSKRSRAMTLPTLFGAMGAVLFVSSGAIGVFAPRYPAYEDILQLAAGCSLLAGLCCFGFGLERAFGMVLLH